MSGKLTVHEGIVGSGLQDRGLICVSQRRGMVSRLEALTIVETFRQYRPVS